jgi:hypothetical protein
MGKTMANLQPNKQDLIVLATRIQDAQDQGEDYSKLLAELQSQVAYPGVGELFHGDYSPDYIVELSLKWQREWPKLSYDQLVELVSKIMSVQGNQADLAIMTRVFEENCIHHAKSDLIYYPDEYFDGDVRPSPERIVKKALCEE